MGHEDMRVGNATDGCCPQGIYQNGSKIECNAHVTKIGTEKLKETELVGVTEPIVWR